MTLMETNTAMNRNDAAGDPLAVARSVLLEPHGLDVKDLNGADRADLRTQGGLRGPVFPVHPQ